MGNHRTKFLVAGLIILICFSWALPSRAATIAELQTQINNLIAQITALQSQLMLQGRTATSTPAACAGIVFNRPLKQGSFGNDVKCLQALLNQIPDTRIAVSGAGSPGYETYYFGYLTKLAVIKYQNKYASEILVPAKLKYGTGIVGAATRTKLNAAFSVSVTTAPISTPTPTSTPTSGIGGGGGGASTPAPTPTSGGGGGASTPTPTPTPTDTTPPVRSSGQPSGTLAAGTTQTTMSLTTSESATCKYSTISGTSYASISNTFTTTGGTAHSRTITGLANGTSYTYYIRCQDSVGNANSDDFPISFSVSSPSCTDCGLGTPIITPSSPVSSQAFTITCPTNSSGYDCIDAYANGSSNLCPFSNNSGNNVIFNCTGLTAGTYTSRCVAKTGTSRNCCAASQVASYTIQAPPDTTAPSQITNLSASNLTQTSVTFNWTAPGDDEAVGTAASYDVRYSTASITGANWTSATQATGEPTPLISGTAQSFTVTGLTANTTYYFAIKTTDETGNVSALSNVVSGTTLISATPPSSNLTLYPWEPTDKFIYGSSALTNQSNSISISACRGEFEPASFFIHSANNVSGVTLNVSNLNSGSGNVIPSSAVDIRLVKAWYQASPGPLTYTTAGYYLTQELLLKDDGLVNVDYVTKTNYLRATINGVEQYIDISSPAATVPTTAQVSDAATLQSFSLKANENKQVWITVRVPNTAPAGNYSGNITINAPSETPVTMNFSVTVLPFDLEPAPLDYGLYYRAIVKSAPVSELTSEWKSIAQYTIEMQDMYNHGVLYPTIYQEDKDQSPGYEPFSGFADIDTVLLVRNQVGLGGKLFVVANTYGYTNWIGNPTAPADLVGTSPYTVESKVKNWRNHSSTYGYTDTYFYGGDEWFMPGLATQRDAWTTVHNYGGKMMASQWASSELYDYMGDILDAAVLGAPLSLTQPPLWHALGHKIYLYNQPQAGVEDPEIYRTNYGIKLWNAGYDGSMDYAYQHGFGQSIWNDFDTPGTGSKWRDHVFAYPTSNGVIDTVQWEGWREGVDDTRYIATLNKLAGTNATAKSIVSSSLAAGDKPSLTRKKIIDAILALL